MEQIKGIFKNLADTILSIFEKFVGSDNSIFSSLKEFFDKLFGGSENA